MINGREAPGALAEEIVGLGRDPIGKPLFQALPETRGQGFDGYLARVRETGEALVFRELPVRLEPTPGTFEEHFIDITYLPLLEGDGIHSAVVAHGKDVTDHVLARRRVEELLIQSETARADAATANAQLREQQLALELANQRLQGAGTPLKPTIIVRPLTRVTLPTSERRASARGNRSCARDYARSRSVVSVIVWLCSSQGAPCSDGANSPYE